MNFITLVEGIKNGTIKIDGKGHLYNDILDQLERSLNHNLYNFIG